MTYAAPALHYGAYCSYMEMRSTCNLVNVQMMHGIYIYISIDVQTLIIMYVLFIVCYDIAMLHLCYAIVHTALALMISIG